MKIWWILAGLFLLGKSKPAPGASVSTPTAAGSATGQQPYIAPTPAGSPSTGADSPEVFNPLAGPTPMPMTVDTPVQNTIVAPGHMLPNGEGATNGLIPSGLSVPSLTDSGGVMMPASNPIGAINLAGDKLLMVTPQGAEIWLKQSGDTYEKWTVPDSAEINFMGPPAATTDLPVRNTTAFLQPFISAAQPAAEPMVPLAPGASITETFNLPDGNGGYVAVSQRNGLSSGVNQ
jgi:hypothetical protein